MSGLPRPGPRGPGDTASRALPIPATPLARGPVITCVRGPAFVAAPRLAKRATAAGVDRVGTGNDSARRSADATRPAIPAGIGPAATAGDRRSGGARCGPRAVGGPIEPAQERSVRAPPPRRRGRTVRMRVRRASLGGSNKRGYGKSRNPACPMVEPRGIEPLTPRLSGPPRGATREGLLVAAMPGCSVDRAENVVHTPLGERGDRERRIGEAVGSFDQRIVPHWRQALATRGRLFMARADQRPT